MEPQFKSGHRMPASGFLDGPGLHTAGRDSPLGIYLVGSNDLNDPQSTFQFSELERRNTSYSR